MSDLLSSLRVVLIVPCSRIPLNANALLNLIKTFPESSLSEAHAADLDVERLLAQTRSRYKMLCSAVGVKPRIRVSRNVVEHASDPTLEREGANSGNKLLQNKSVWMIEKNLSGSGEDQDFSF